MIMRNRQAFYDESIWERIEARLKSWVLINYYLKKMKIHEFVMDSFNFSLGVQFDA